MSRSERLGAAVLLVVLGCGGGEPGRPDDDAPPTAAMPLDTLGAATTITGFSGPEAVRHDPGQGVWFVANFGAGSGDPRDGDGFISRVRDGAIDSLRFMTGTADAPLHMPRGMYIEGDTLWVADVDGVHGFDRRSGAHLAFLDFTAHEPGFLNDVAAGPDGVLYVTDTGRSRVYRVEGAGGRPEIVADSLPDPVNGITWDAGRGAFLLAPWGDGTVIRSLAPGGVVDSAFHVPAGRFDGIEVLGDGVVLAATQTDSSLWLVEGGVPRRVVRTRGRPADIGFDRDGGLVAVPYIALDRVDVWKVR